MPADFNEKINEYYESIRKPWIELAELNMNAVSKLSKNTDLLEKVLKAKKPEEFISAQIELTSAATLEGVKYIQEVSSIWIDTISQIGEKFTYTTREAAKKTSESMKTSKA